MKKVIAIWTVVLGCALLAFAFNNCSDVDFSDAGAPGTRSDLSGEANSSDLGTELNDEEVDDFLNSLPEEELDQKRPLTDLEEDPTLYDLYQCSDSGNIVICHFPENVEAQETRCVGEPSVSSHYDHIRFYTVDGQEREIGDYLGPCRFPL